jgi:hypothetical protein
MIFLRSKHASALGALVLTTILCGVAAAQDMTVFGIPLGQPLQMPRCMVLSSWENPYEPPERVCFKQAGNNAVGIDFPKHETPALVRPMLEGSTVWLAGDGNLEGAILNEMAA